MNLNRQLQDLILTTPNLFSFFFRIKSIKDAEISSKQYRLDLANLLIEKGVLSETETERYYSPGDSKALVFNRILDGISKKISTFRAASIEREREIDGIRQLRGIRDPRRVSNHLASDLLGQLIDGFLHGGMKDKTGRLMSSEQILQSLKHSYLYRR